MKRTPAEVEGFINSMDKLYAIPEFKVYLEELRNMRDEILSKAYEGNEEHALKVIGLVKGIEVALSLNKRYVHK